MSGVRKRPARGCPEGIPSVPRNHGKRGSGSSPRASPLQLQNRPIRSKYYAVGVHLPTLRSRTPNPERMAKGNGENRKNQTLLFTGWLTDPLCTQTTWKRTTPMCGLPSIKSHHDPKSVSLTPHAGTTGPSPGSTMVHENGPQKRISSYPNQRRR